MNFARENHTATLLPNGQVLVTGGDNFTQGFLNNAELYNPATGRWTLTANMSVQRVGHGAVLLQNGQVLVAGGYNSNPGFLTTAELYNPATGTWTATGSMTTGRASFLMLLLANGQVLAAGGDGFLTSAELYNPVTGTWSATGSMPIGNDTSWGVLLQNGEAFNLLELYKPLTGTWSTTAKDPIGASAPVVLLPTGDVFAAGGIQGSSIYHPATDQWTNFAPPPCTTIHQGCEGGGALLSTGKVLVAGGITEAPGQPYPKAETNGIATLLDPSTLTWASTPNMKVPRVGETVTVLSNGQVLFAGGETFDKSRGALTPIADAELYKP
ncbi:MAG TPA: kelch repeat-containing protein [Candidatus Sulfotelmatobacter sp.]|nr:kelch repeat-containing protein [Candidatus Sulfotelmatobacter sp.]